MSNAKHFPVAMAPLTLSTQIRRRSSSLNPPSWASSRTLSGKPSGTLDAVPLKNSRGGRRRPSDSADRTTSKTGLSSGDPNSWKEDASCLENWSELMKTGSSSMQPQQWRGSAPFWTWRTFKNLVSHDPMGIRSVFTPSTKLK